MNVWSAPRFAILVLESQTSGKALCIHIYTCVDCILTIGSLHGRGKACGRSRISSVISHIQMSEGGFSLCGVWSEEQINWVLILNGFFMPP